MWNGELTDIFYEDVFSLVCCKHKDKEKDIPDKEKIRSILKESFILVRMKTLCFMIDCDERASHLLEDLSLFKDKSHPTLDEKIKHKDELILIESVCTFTLSLYAKICVICTPIKNLEDLRKFRDSYDVQHFIGKDKKIMPSYLTATTKQYNHYKKVRECFDKYDTKFVEFAFAASCSNFFHYFANESAGFLDEMHSAEGLAHYKIVGNEAYKNGEYDRAFRLYLEGLQVAPFSYQLFGNCAQACLKLENYEAAELFSRFALIMQPEYCKAYYKLATSIHAQGEYRKACDIASFGLRQCPNSDCLDCIGLRNYEGYLRNLYANKVLGETLKKAGMEWGKKPNNASDSDDEMPALTDDDDDDDYTSESTQDDLDDLSVEEPLLLDQVEQSKPVIAKENQNFESANQLNEATIDQEIQNIVSSNKLNELVIEQEEILHNKAINECSEKEISEVPIVNSPLSPKLDKLDLPARDDVKESSVKENVQLDLPARDDVKESGVTENVQLDPPAGDDVKKSCVKGNVQLDLQIKDDVKESGVTENVQLDLPSGDDVKESGVTENVQLDLPAGDDVKEAGVTENVQLDPPAGDDVKESCVKENVQLDLRAGNDVKESGVKENVQLDLRAGSDVKESGVKENVQLDLPAGDDGKKSYAKGNVQLDLPAGDDVKDSGVAENVQLDLPADDVKESCVKANVQLDLPAGDDGKESYVKENVQLDLPAGNDLEESGVKENVQLDLPAGVKAEESGVKENLRNDVSLTKTLENSCEDSESEIDVIPTTVLGMPCDDCKMERKKCIEDNMVQKCKISEKDKIKHRKLIESIVDMEFFLDKVELGLVDEQQDVEFQAIEKSLTESLAEEIRDAQLQETGNSHSELPENQSSSVGQKPKTKVAFSQDPSDVVKLESSVGNTESCFDYAAGLKFENALVEGSSALKVGLTSMAMLYFKQALAMLNQLPEMERKKCIEGNMVQKCKISEKGRIKHRKLTESIVDMEFFLDKVELGLVDKQDVEFQAIVKSLTESIAEVIRDPRLQDTGNSRSELPENQSSSVDRKPKPKTSKMAFSQDPSDVVKLESSVGNTKSDLPENRLSAADQTPKAENSEVCFDYAAVLKFENALVEGSSALKMGLMSMAMLHFKQALAMLNQLPELARHGKVDPMIVKFACGYASFKCNSAENLNIAIENFKDVIQNYPNPLAQAYYFLGLAYSKQNQFQAALPYLETVDSMPEGTYNFEAYDLFDEKALKLFSYNAIQASLKDEITRCMHPPMPEAICRYENCLDDPAIYTSGIAFKKFMCIRCQQRCILQYHIPCWKSIKEAREKTDKEFLDTSCFTPDCNGLIVRVEMIGKDGVIERDFTSEDNYKPKNSTKQRKTKLEKKCEQKERKKQTRVRQMSEKREISVDDIEQETEIKNADEPKFDPEPKAESHSHNLSKKTNTTSLNEDKKQAPELPVNAEPLYVIKKDTDSKEPENKQPKHKEKKKSKKSTFSIDEFIEGVEPGVVNCNDYQLRLHKLQESKRVIEEDPSFELPLLVSQKCVTEVPNTTSFCTAEKVPKSHNVIHDPELADFSDDYNSQLREAIYMHFENFLDVHGFIKLTDPCLKDEIENLAPEMKNLIELEGGFVPFIQKPYKLFAIVHNNLCLFRDMMNVYNARNIDQLDDFSQGYQPEGMYDSLSVIDDGTCIDRSSLLDDDGNQIDLFTENKENDVFKELQPVDENIEAVPMIKSSCEVFLTSNDESKIGFSPLNPNAKEYNPSVGSGSSESHPCAPGSSEDSCSIQSSIDTNRGEEISLLSRVNGMRQELTSYSLECDKDNLPSLADTSSESLLQEESLSFHSDAVDTNEKVDSHNLCVDSIHKHFLTLLNNENKDTIHKSYQDLRFLIRQLEKMILAKSDASVQAGVSEADMISCGVMKEDEEFLQIKSEFEHLSDSVLKLQEEKSGVEERLTEALDKQMELQNKYQVETSMLKKEIEENKVTTEDANKNLKKKCATLEKDVKQWRQKYELAVEKEKELSTENERLKVKVKSFTSKVVELEKEFTNFKSEQEIKKREYNGILREYEDQFKKDAEEKFKEIKEIQEQLRDTELDILNLKRTEYEKSFQKYSADANAKIQDLRSGIQQLKSSTGDPFTISTLKVLLDKVVSYIEDMHANRSVFYTRVVEQINKVKGGTSLKSMPNLEIPTFSPIPTVETVLESLPMATQQSTQNNSILPSLQKAPAVQFPAQVFPLNSSQNVLPTSQNSSSGGLNHVNMTMNPAYCGQEPAAAMQNFMLYMTAPYGNESTNLDNLNSVPAVAKSAPSASPILSPMSVPGLLQGHDIWYNNSVVPSAPRTLSADKTSVTTAPPGLTSVRPRPEVASALNQILPSSIDEINPPGQRNRRTSSVCSLDDLATPVIKPDPRPDSGVIGSKRPSSIVSSISNIPIQASNLETKTTPAPVGPGGDSASNLELGYSGISRPSSTTGSIIENSSVIGIPLGVGAEKFNPSSGYGKVLVMLKSEFPHLSDCDLMWFIKQYREQKGRLSYMPVAIIFAGVKELITQRKNQSAPKVVRPKALVNKPLVSSSIPPPPPSSKSNTPSVAPWAKSEEKPLQNWKGELSDNTCSVCLEEMNPLSSYKVDCGHFFHLKCIKQWLNMESNCPICRVHLLLPEDFPRLS